MSRSAPRQRSPVRSDSDDDTTVKEGHPISSLAGVEFALNVNQPGDQWLLCRERTIEPRDYALKSELQGQRIAIISCPTQEGGGAGSAPQQVVGVVRFGKSKKYSSKEEWEADCDMHKVGAEDSAAWGKAGRTKHGWTVRSVERLTAPLPLPAKTHHWKSFYRLLAQGGRRGSASGRWGDEDRQKFKPKEKPGDSSSSVSSDSDPDLIP